MLNKQIYDDIFPKLQGETIENFTNSFSKC